VEEVMVKSAKGKTAQTFFETEAAKPELIKDVPLSEISRINTSNTELDRVLGGGMVPGSLILVGGEPGIGKSTLVLQMALKIQSKKVLYVSGEESPQQIKLRADRIHKDAQNCLVVSETSMEKVLGHVKNVNPDLLEHSPLCAECANFGFSAFSLNFNKSNSKSGSIKSTV